MLRFRIAAGLLRSRVIACCRQTFRPESASRVANRPQLPQMPSYEGCALYADSIRTPIITRIIRSATPQKYYPSALAAGAPI